MSKISKKKNSAESNAPKRKSLFDHVNHIRKVQDPNYYVDLSEDDRKSFNHFMILRALSMDESLVEDIAQLFQLFDKIPSPQFYQLLIALVPKSNRFYPWVKSKAMKHNKDLLGYVSKRFRVSKYQAQDYINILIRTEAGQQELVDILKGFGLDDSEVEKLFEERKYDE